MSTFWIPSENGKERAGIEKGRGAHTARQGPMNHTLVNLYPILPSSYLLSLVVVSSLPSSYATLRYQQTPPDILRGSLFFFALFSFSVFTLGYEQTTLLYSKIVVCL